MGKAYLEISTLKRENFHFQRQFLNQGSSRDQGPALCLLWPHLAFSCEMIRHRGPFTGRTGSLSYKNPIYFQRLTAKLRFQGRRGD